MLEQVAPKKEEMVTDELMQEWSAAYGKIFRTMIGGDIYIWRRLRRPEYVDIMTGTALPADIDIKENDHDRMYYIRQELICKTVVLFPNKETMAMRLDEEAGLASSLSDQISNRSGFLLYGTSEITPAITTAAPEV